MNENLVCSIGEKINVAYRLLDEGVFPIQVLLSIRLGNIAI